MAKSSLKFDPNVVVTSPILRARQTADIVKRRFGNGLKVDVDDCLMPESRPAQVTKYLNGMKKDDRVVLISHMPLIFDLLHDLIGGEGEVELLNGSIAAIGFKGKAASGKGKLEWLIQPVS